MPPGPNLFPQSYNQMQAQAGLLPMGTPQMPPIMIPMGMQVPQTPHPGQVAGMLQQQAMMAQYISPAPSQIFGSTTMGMPGMFGPSLPHAMYGNANRARQIGVRESGSTLAMAQGGVGVGARMAGNMIASSMIPFGGMLYEGLGIGQGVQNMTNAMFAPIIQQRERALALQNASTGFVMGGSMLSATGQGMSGVAAQQVTSGLGRLADNSAFRRETGGMFNRADLDRIARISGELGMLDNTQSADQMLREVKRVSKAVSNFMRIVEEPDLQKAMQRMGQMRNMGFGVADMASAGANARSFARMAGVSMDQAMETATAQSSIFRQMGLSNAAGFQASLGAQGMSRQLAALMDPRRLNMAGGIEGIQQTMMNGAANAATNDPFMMAMLTRRNGQLAIDPQMMQRLMSGNMSISDVMRQAGSNMRGLGGRAAIDEMFTRRNELNDQLTSMVGPQGQMLMPLLHARMIQRMTGGSLGEALRQTGMSEQDARTYEQMGQNPEFFTNMRRQMDISMRERAVEARDRVRERTTAGAAFHRGVHHAVGRHLEAFGAGVMDPIQRALAEEQDREEALALQGEGPARVVRGLGAVGAAFTGGVRDQLGARGAQGQRFNEMMADINRSAQARAQREASTDATLQNIPVVRMFHGPQGWGVTNASRGGNTYRSTIMAGAGLGDRAAESLGFGAAASAEEVERLGREQEELGNLMANAGRGGAQGAIQRSAQARALFGNTAESRDTAARARAAATVAMQEYVQSQYSLGGMVRTGTAAASGMREAVRRRMAAQGISSEQINRALQDQGFMGSAMSEARRGVGESMQAQFDEMQQIGSDASSAFTGRSMDATRAIAESERNTVVSMLGLDTGINTEQAGVSAVTEILTGGGSEQDQALRQKLFTAILMTRSDDPDERQQGHAAIGQLQNQYGEEAVDAARAQVEAQMDNLSESDIEDIRSSLGGGTFEERSANMTRAAHHVRRMQAAEGATSRTRVLGGRAGDAYAQGGVAGLRQHAGDIKDENIRRLVESGASDADIERAVTEASRRAVTGETGATAVGAEASAEDREAAGNTEAMITAITTGMTEFPTAVTQMSESAQALQRAASQLSTVSEDIRIATGLNRANH